MILAVERSPSENEDPAGRPAGVSKKGIKPVLDEEMAPDANDATAQVLRLKQPTPTPS